MPGKQAMARIGELARRFDMHFFEFSPPAQRRSDSADGEAATEKGFPCQVALQHDSVLTAK